MKIDLHCHSKYSKRPSLWIMQKIGCPESFTDPLELYQLARRRGMKAVTITDHNFIDGCLSIAHLPGTFIGCEYTTYFPEDRCKIHVLTYGITEKQHKQLNQIRTNIYDFVDYLRANNIWHICAHPLFSPNDRLKIEHLERLLLLFKNWEINGDLNPETNAAMLGVLESLTPEIMEKLADKHGIIPGYEQPWKKNLTAGSDDHGSLHVGQSYTEVTGAGSLEEFRAGVESGQARTTVQQSTPHRLARNVYSITYQFYKDRLNLHRYVNKDLFLCFLERAMLPHREDLDGGPSWYHRMFSRCLKPRRKNRKSATLIEMARLEAEKLIKDDPQLSAIVHEGQGAAGDLDRQWEEFVNRLSSKVLVEFGRKTLDRLAGARLFDLFHSAGSAGALYALLAPYFVGFSLHASQRTWARQVEKHFSSENPANGNGSKPRRIRVAHFTDTFDEDNSVARTIRQSLESALQTSADYTILICAREGRTFQRGVRQFTSIGSFELPEYPELKVLCPPLLQMLNHCYEEDYTHIHIATPGPVGLAGLAIARILHLPVVGTYHTCLPQYAKVLTDDGYIEDILWRCMIWFYDQMDRVYVPSRATGRQLAGRGLTEEKIMVYPRGVDLDHFRPERRSSAARKELQLEEQKTVFIYAGRVCQEKNLHLISRAFRTLYEKGHPCQLLIAGDGPYRSKMESDLSETGAVFTGHLDGEKLADLYASSDVLVYPSANDTFGNAVLEAQASGIPVIVSDAGGPCENVIPGQTGLVVRAQNIEELTAAMEEMVLHPERRLKMGAAAREEMKKRDRIEAFREYWNLYTDFQRVENGEKHLTDSFLGAGLASEVSALAPEG